MAAEEKRRELVRAEIHRQLIQYSRYFLHRYTYMFTIFFGDSHKK